MAAVFPEETAAIFLNDTGRTIRVLNVTCPNPGVTFLGGQAYTL
jgi:hypothetical protein